MRLSSRTKVAATMFTVGIYVFIGNIGFNLRENGHLEICTALFRDRRVDPSASLAVARHMIRVREMAKREATRLYRTDWSSALPDALRSDILADQYAHLIFPREPSAEVRRALMARTFSPPTR